MTPEELELENDKLYERLNEAKLEIDTLSQDVLTGAKKQAELISERDSLRAQISDLETRLLLAQQTLFSSQAKLDQVPFDIAALQHSNDTYKAGFEKQLKAHDALIVQINKLKEPYQFAVDKAVSDKLPKGASGTAP